MKSQKQRQKSNRSVPAKEPSKPPTAKPAAAPPSTNSRPKQWLFRLIALVFVPLFLLGGFELALRLFGYGYPTRFFLPREISGRKVLVENQKFGWRFFPKALARTPQPVVLPAHKPADTYRIFILGESAAMGDPEPAYGFGRLLEVLLRARYAGAHFEVVNAAMTAINSHVILPVARDCARQPGDLWVVYMGHNEVVGPFGAGTVFGPQAPSLAFIRANIGLKALRIGQLLDDVQKRMRREPHARPSWGGMEMFLGQQIRRADPRIDAVYGHFQKNLADILDAGIDAGVKVVVSTVVSNLKDCPPFASLHRPNLTDAQRAEWEKIYQAGVAREAAGSYGEAVEHYRRAAAIDDRFAELPFRLGRCLWALGRYEEARQYYEQACDYDTLRFRADTRINQTIRQVAAARRAQGVYFVDGNELLARQSPYGIPGEELLYEHVHFNFDGNYLLARNLAEQVARLLPAAISQRAGAQGDWLSVGDCAQRLAFTIWNRYQVLEDVCRRLQKPPFTLQLDHPARVQRWQNHLAALKPYTQPAALKQAAEVYRQALALAPDDWVLHEKLAALLEAYGDTAGAAEQWWQVLQLLPHRVPALYGLGNLLDSQGKSAEAQTYFSQVLQLKPDSFEALNGLGLALANQGKTAEAIAKYSDALRINPDFAEAHVNWGVALAAQGKIAEAVAHYNAALRLKPDSPAAHINLGKILVGQGKLAEAIDHYSAAVRLRPEDAVAHYNLGNALAAQGRRPEALTHYAEAVRFRPDFAEAHYNLGLELAREGQSGEALEHFSEVVRLKPNHAEAHLNLGVALAKQHHLDEAIRHFQETLRLDPSNPSARQFLETAQTLRGKSR